MKNNLKPITKPQRRTKIIMENNSKLAIIGLGYVGLPLAAEFAKKYDVVGLDIYQTRIDELNQAKDRKMGARGLRSIMENFMLKIMYGVPSLNNIDTCIITDEVVIKKVQPIYKLLRKSA